KTDASSAQNAPNLSTSLVANDCDQAVSTSRIAFASASRVSGAGGGASLQPATMSPIATAAGTEYRFCMTVKHITVDGGVRGASPALSRQSEKFRFEQSRKFLLTA